MTDDRLFGMADTVRVSLAWLRQRHECNAAGIAERCHGACCYAPRWPATSSGPGVDGACSNLGPTGCMLGDGRPVTCHLYPLRHRVDGDRIERHFRAGVPQGVCKGNAGHGPPLVAVLESNLRYVFGDHAYESLRRLVLDTDLRGVVAVELAPGIREKLTADHLAEAAGVWPAYATKETPCHLTQRRQ